MKTKKVYVINGMHCTSCSMLIEGELEDIGVTARASYAKGLVEVEFDEGVTNNEDITKAVSRAGYSIKTD